MHLQREIAHRFGYGFAVGFAQLEREELFGDARERLGLGLTRLGHGRVLEGCVAFRSFSPTVVTCCWGSWEFFVGPGVLGRGVKGSGVDFATHRPIYLETFFVA